MSTTAEIAAIIPAYLSFEQSGVYVGISESSVKRLVECGKLTPFRPIGGRTVLSRAELDNYMRSVANGKCRRGTPTHGKKQPSE